MLTLPTATLFWYCPECGEEIPYAEVEYRARWFGRGIKARFNFSGVDIAAHTWTHAE